MMKKILLFVSYCVLILSLNSCSSDSDSDKATGTISFKVNGVQKTFTGLHSHEHVYHLNETEYTSVNIRTDSDDTTFDWFQFSLIKGNLQDSTYFSYVMEGNMIYNTADDFTVHITSNGDDKKLIGTFSGDMTRDGETLTITEGSFNVQY